MYLLSCVYIGFICFELYINRIIYVFFVSLYFVKITFMKIIQTSSRNAGLGKHKLLSLHNHIKITSKLKTTIIQKCKNQAQWKSYYYAIKE